MTDVVGPGYLLGEGTFCPETGDRECMACSGEACRKCGAGCWDSTVRDCEHDVVERHKRPTR